MTRPADRFDVSEARPLMKAVVTTGVGGYERLDYRDVPVPVPGPGEVLLQVLAAGVNNTEINTRMGWYSADVATGTAGLADSPGGISPVADGGWNRPTPFPFIQGTDCCGRVVRVGPDVDPDHSVGRRVLVRSCMRPDGFGSMDSVWLGSDIDGAFAEYVAVPVSEVFPVDCAWSDAELATIPCAYGTAENMLRRAKVGPGEHVLVTGASGGVGSAAVQLARRRGARVTAVCGREKVPQVADLGVEQAIPRGEDVAAALGSESVDVVVDNVAGPQMPRMLDALRRGGRYVSSGAIAGPVVTLDLRTVYLKDLRLIGCTAWDEPVMPDLVGYIERGEIQPLLAATYPLAQVVEAQREFLKKRHFGKLVLLPPAGSSV